MFFSIKEFSVENKPRKNFIKKHPLDYLKRNTLKVFCIKEKFAPEREEFLNEKYFFFAYERLVILMRAFHTY